MKNNLLSGLLGSALVLNGAPIARGDAIFVSNYQDGKITHIAADGAKNTFATVHRAPFGIIFDRNGNLLVAQAQMTNKISAITPSGTVALYRTLPNYFDATAITFGADGAFYVASQNGFNIRKGSTTFATGFVAPMSMAFDQNGILYVADAYFGRVSKVAPNGVVSAFATGLPNVWGIAFDAAGDLFVANGGLITRIKPDGTKSTFAAGFSFPSGIAFDSSGDLYVAEQSAGTVKRVSPDGVVHPFASGLATPLYIAIKRDSPAPFAAELAITSPGSLTLTAPLEQWYVLSWTADFQSWTPFRTNRVIAGPLSIDDPTAVDQSHRFYRAQAR